MSGPSARTLELSGFLSLKEAAARAGVSVQTLNTWVRRGVTPKERVRLEAAHAGRRRFIHPDELSRFLSLTGRQPSLPFGEADAEAA